MILAIPTFSLMERNCFKINKFQILFGNNNYCYCVYEVPLLTVTKYIKGRKIVATCAMLNYSL